MVMDWNEYQKQIGSRIGDLAKLSPDTVKGYQTLGAANSKTSKLGEKTRQLISLAVAVTTRCDGCIVFHTEAALKAGATKEFLASSRQAVVLARTAPGCRDFVVAPDLSSLIASMSTRSGSQKEPFSIFGEADRTAACGRQSSAQRFFGMSFHPAVPHSGAGSDTREYRNQPRATTHCVEDVIAHKGRLADSEGSRRRRDLFRATLAAS